MYVEHDVCRLFHGFIKYSHQDFDNKLHGGVIIIVQKNTIKKGFVQFLVNRFAYLFNAIRFFVKSHKFSCPYTHGDA